MITLHKKGDTGENTEQYVVCLMTRAYKMSQEYGDTPERKPT